MKKIILTIFCLGMLFPLLGSAARPYGVEEIPNVQVGNRYRFTSNPDGVLSPSAVAEIDSLCYSLRHRALAQVAVVAVEDIRGDDLFSFAHTLFSQWGVGRADSDNGLGILLVVDRREVRFVTGPVSYGTGAPGGLFAPMLALGALTGAGFGRILEALYAPFGDLTPALVVVGMSTLFAAVVRVPLTAIVLVMEMTAVTALTVPMAVAVTAGVATASLAGSKPVYDALRERYLRDIGVSGVAVRPHD